ncbi:hypothetical protein HMPREF3056_02735 [Corynebacterium sp. HMSC056F09]|uniref:TRAP transporter small permease n=1 Tax=unclassified Corynebacterium TaxID=2624378 RepID=UPI0008A46BFB|nr:MULTISPECIES: TRAP transporter small permease [unclassified Corynebacterium]OFK66376.1 hypothetical protein HMPREF2807_09485 [Corynebacterium sp. HMSC074A09]OFN79676.1 hypothetical protein HMPREF2526_00805 [Corynebacterium sp. HMSC070E08]OFO18407.1 hypothetical protein HMPREF3056_02735 [Corynebacterium sp. HMSC056F09]
MHSEETRGTSHHKLYVDEYIGAGILGIMTILLFVQVFSRFILQNSLSWSEELSRYMFIWMNFLLLGIVTLRGEHIAIDVLTSKLKGGVKKIAMQFVIIACFIVNIILLVFAIQIATTLFQLGQTSAALQLPMWVVYSALPFGLVLCCLRMLQTSGQIWLGTSPLLDDNLELELAERTQS